MTAGMNPPEPAPAKARRENDVENVASAVGE
jgi:hypothetical protein